MARDLFGVEKGLGIFAENGDLRISVLQGTLAPDGVSGDQGAAPIGSLYVRSGTGELYQKVANAGAPADWVQFGEATGIGNWRPERVDIHTGDVLTASSFDPTSLTDNDDGIAAGDLTVGHYMLDGNCDLWEITAISAPNVTIAAAASAPVTQDMFAVRYNLPDPAGQENQAIITFDGTSCIKVADVDFATATGINLSGGYVPAGGDVTASDSVESAIAKLDDNLDDLTAAVGVSQGDQNMGTYTGTLLNDNESAKQNIQQLETQVETNQSDIATNAGDIAANTSDIADIRTLTGTVDGDTDYGTFTGDLYADNQSGKQLFQRTEDLLDELKMVEAAAITTQTVVDSVPTASVFACKWLLVATEDATPANKQAIEIYALNNGTTADDTTYAKLKVGGNFNLQVSVDVSGGDMRLLVASSSAGVSVKVRRIEVVDI